MQYATHQRSPEAEKLFKPPEWRMIDGDVVKECYAFLGEHGEFGWLADLHGEIDDDDFNRMEWIVSDWMWDEMNAIAPDGFYFGANAGDGACFGFWKCDENEY